MNDVDPNLKDVLGHRAAGVRVVASLAERAIERDRSQRRRQLAAGALAAALVLAVAVPVGWGALRATDGRPFPVGPSQSTSLPSGLPSPSSPRTTTPTTADPTPTAIPTLTADGAPAPVTLKPATGDRTGPASVPYVADGVIHDGARQIRLTGKVLGGSLARLAGGHWLVAQGETGVLHVVDSAGATLVRLGGQATKVAADGSLFVVEQLGTLTAYDANGTLVRTLRSTSCDCTPEGVSDADSPGYDVVGIIGSVVYANRGFTGQAIAWDVETGVRRPVAGSLELVDAARGTALVPVAQKAGSKQACTELRELASGRVLWQLCGPLVFRSFSTNGDYLLATGYSDGLEASQLNPDRSFRYGSLVVVRTSDAAIVLEGGSTDAGTTTPSPVTYRMGEDGSLTVQVGTTAGRRNLQRCTLDGHCEVVAPNLPRWSDIPEGDDPYFLSAN
ncbi:hypothetical protein [Terrabacter sp. BE26]|uniref:hypothetical protein n=1 Tax=Terrabacter sp. BE26 TaxID=2898152 RepID=UPI0035BE9CE0